MGKVAVTFGDATAATLAILRELYTATPPLHDASPVAGLTFGTRRPYTAELKTPSLPYGVVVEERWGPTTWPITATLRMRIMFWGDNPDQVADIANWAHARLLTYSGGPEMVSFAYNAGPIGAWDPDHPDTPMSAFTTLARPRAAVL